MNAPKDYSHEPEPPDTRDDCAKSDRIIPQEGTTSDLALRIYLAVSSYRHGISYATAEGRFYRSASGLDPSWEIVAQKLLDAVDESISERLLKAFR